MIVTPAIGNLIREGKSHQIYNAIDTGSKLGMVSMDRSLASLVQEGIITMEVAESKANDINLLHNYAAMTGAGAGYGRGYGGY
mgnify:CR=1 FL=1